VWGQNVARTVTQGFEEFLNRLVPLESQRKGAALHRASVESSLNNALEVQLFRETGSFGHGTGVRGYCDVDVLVSLKHKPGSSDTALSWVKTALSRSFPHTTIRISRPAVVVEFNSGEDTWEVIPGFRRTSSGDTALYDIPGVATEWLESAPLEHIAYVNDVNSMSKIAGGAKRLARLAKAWKYFNGVPISSFYLEMRAAKYMEGESGFAAVWDVCRLFEYLEGIQVGPMNDPKGVTARFYACSTTAKGVEALSKVQTAAARARKALDAHKAEDPTTAFHYLDLLFGGHFPTR
jgi:Second Messenger Oligonucleotide or Dinucleotide Synthetase domain